MNVPQKPSRAQRDQCLPMNTHDLFSLKGRPATNTPGASPVSTEASPTSVLGRFDSAVEEAAHSTFPSNSESKNASPQVGHASERFESEDEKSSADGAGQAANILLFPTPSVIIPFPALGVGVSDIANSELRIPNSTESTRNHSTHGTGEVLVPFPTTEAGGEIGEKSAAPVAEEEDGKMVDPEPAYRVESANNIRTVNFNQPTVPRQDGPVSSLVVVAFRDDQITESSDLSGSAQLPTGRDARENIADPFDNSDLFQQLSKGGVSVVKPLPSMGSAALPALPAIPPEPTGITAARQGSGMNYSSDSSGGSALIDRKEGAPEQFPGVRVSLEGSPVDFSARMAADAWQLGQLGGSLDQAVKTSPERKDYSAAVERLSSLVRREAALVRQYHSDSMAVVLRPDTDTELFVHFSRRHGQIEVTIRCERGDTLPLAALWPQLQESLAHHKVRLAPLQEPVSNNPNVSLGSEWGNRRNGFSRHTPDQQFMDETPALATSEPDSPTLRAGGGSRHRRVTTSRPGWETWA
jgi:hypothetical protein